MNRTLMTFGHLSDPHLTVPEPTATELLGKRALSYLSWRRKRRYVFQRSILDTVTADLAAAAVDHIAVTGDLTHLGLPGECAAALDWLHTLGSPEDVTVIPGNHEYLARAPWTDTVGRWRAFFGDDERHDGAPEPWPTVRHRGQAVITALNSGAVTAPLLATGRLGAAQRHALFERLAAQGAEGCFRIVLIHHSPLSDGHSRRKRLEDAEHLQQLFQQAGVELVLHGHGHVEALRELTTSQGKGLVVGAPSPVWRARASQVGTSIRSPGKPPGGAWTCESTATTAARWRPGLRRATS